MSRPHDPAIGHRPLYARMLRLRTLTPSGFVCFVFLEGAIALGILLALAELVSWWGVLVLPATVAIMVKLNDVIAGSLTPPAPLGPSPSAGLGAAARSAGADALAEHAASLRPAGMAASAVLATRDGRPAGRVGEESTARLPGVVDGGRGPIKRPWAERAEAQQQWLRQSATRRYE
ncbi:hypothetical protein [Actinoplanes sp. M2I2]|uniref:hypothetical protein n=1 Tax=Actinoplanes sp. M2I2 TaxID=1734444 RepID=UPI002021A7F0|nr:hypothetical protein [Actinoplanes sp. M2I2]